MKAIFSALFLSLALQATTGFAAYDPTALINEFRAAGITIYPDGKNLESNAG